MKTIAPEIIRFNDFVDQHIVSERDESVTATPLDDVFHESTYDHTLDGDPTGLPFDTVEFSRRYKRLGNYEETEDPTAIQRTRWLELKSGSLSVVGFIHPHRGEVYTFSSAFGEDEPATRYVGGVIGLLERAEASGWLTLRET